MALTITITLTDDEVADVAATVAPATAQEWITSNLSALVAQCTTAQKTKKATAAGLGADLTKFGVTDAEQDAIIATRVQAKAEAAAAVEAAAIK